VIREWIEQNARTKGDTVYLEEASGNAAMTYADLRRSASAWERQLTEAGVPAGARVAILLPDPVSYAGSLVSIVAAGRVAVPLDPAAPPAELTRVLGVAEPRAVIWESTASYPPGLAVLSPPVLRPPALPPPGPQLPGGDRAPGSPTDTQATGGIFLCTSGTTGTPKGIELREEQLAHVAAAVVRQHRLTPADRGYCCLPLFHVNAEVVGLLATLCAGAGLVLDRAFSRRRFWPVVEERRITWINAVPAIITVLCMEQGQVKPPERVRFIRSASAPLPPTTLIRFEQLTGVPVIETYGMTEAASMITANPLDGPRKPGSVGRAAGAEVRVIRYAGPETVRCEDYVVGQVQIRGPGVITRYATGGHEGAIDRDGWLDTGDLGHLDEDGYLYLAGRADDVINRGGEKIYPREIEEVLLAQPGVLSAVVVGAEDEVLGQRPVAYIVPSDSGFNGTALEDALFAGCAAALPKPKRPSSIVIAGELPLGPTGKVARRRLRELAAANSNFQDRLVFSGAMRSWWLSPSRCCALPAPVPVPVFSMCREGRECASRPGPGRVNVRDYRIVWFYPLVLGG
jgi:oxalate---CoA ligase